MSKLKRMKETLYKNTNTRQRFVLLFLALAYVSAAGGAAVFLSMNM